ncbi:MAG: hypothetical protein J6M53_06560 [Bacteroidaceae bacterium]|nr:hypothetical protein [Bacteroidaceae bacterium]
MKILSRSLALALLASASLMPTSLRATTVPGDTLAPADDYKFRLGGYGEAVASWKDYGLNRWTGTSDGSSRVNHSTIEIPRFVIAMDYKFSRRWTLGAEIEFEAGGTGIEYEMEQGSGSENGEYETEVEKGGEVALEQFHITYSHAPWLNVRAGHMVLPVGLTNSHHEPIFFFGTRRTEGETTIIPSTWHETGLSLFGRVGSRTATFDYEAMVVAGPNPNGFDKYNWVQKGKQGYFEADNFTRPAYILRLDWVGLPNLRIGGSVYWCADAGRNADKLVTYKAYGKLPVCIYSLDGQYTGRFVTARANYLSGNVHNADAISGVNRRYSSASPYNRTPYVAKRAVTWSAEVGVNLHEVCSALGWTDKMPVIYPFAHYNYYNPQEKGQSATSDMDARCQVSLWKVGLNWRPLPNLVVKADYTTRQIGTSKMFGKGQYNSENEWSLGVAYVGWFFKK